MTPSGVAAGRGMARVRWRGPAVALVVPALNGLWTILFARWALPIPGGDAQFFLPPAFFMANGLSWLSPMAAQLDPSLPQGALARYIYHGWFYPFLLGAMATHGSWHAVLVAHSVLLAVAAVLLCLLSIHRAESTFEAVGAALVICGLMAAYGGRPEELATLLLVAIAATLRGTGGPRPAISAIAFALLFLTQPTICFSAAIGYAAVLVAMHPPAAAARDLALVGATSLGLALLAFLVVFPYPLNDWFSGVLNQVELLSQRHEIATFIDYYIAYPSFPLFVAFPIAALVFLQDQLWSLRQRAWRLLATGALLALFLAPIITNFVHAPATIYMVMPWCAVLVFFWLNRDRADDGRRPALVAVMTVALAVLALGAAVGLARPKIQQLAALGDPRAAYAFNSRILRVVVNACRTTVIDPKAIYLLRTSDILGGGLAYAKDNQAPAVAEIGAGQDAYVSVQYGTGGSTPPNLAGFRTVYDGYAAPIRLFGLTVGRSSVGYNLAVAVRIGTPCMERVERSLAARRLERAELAASGEQ
jgi:hypothetical protein